MADEMRRWARCGVEVLYSRRGVSWDVKKKIINGVGAMSSIKTRSFLYGLACFLGDVQAVKSGRVGRRIAERGTGRLPGKPVR
jgi:hypothetical protein